MKRIRSGDTVIVIAGKSKGHVGVVKQNLGERLVVEGANMIKKHVKADPSKQQSGGIITREAPIHVSNVNMYNPVSKRADKVGFKIIDNDGVSRKVRYFKSNDEVIDLI